MFLGMVFSSCQKEGEVIAGNVVGPDPTVSLVQIRQYIQKVYLAINGTVPSDSVMEAELNFLAGNNCSVSDRDNLLNRLFADEKYKSGQYAIKNDLLLQGILPSEISDIISDINRDLNDPGSSIDTAILNDQLEAMQLLKTSRQEYIDGLINLVEVQKRMTASLAFNYANGSGSSWINAVYDFFLFRSPTLDEEDQVYAMISGFPGYIFLQPGTSQDDFISIFFSSRPFMEGQVRAMFKEYLYREPNTSELNSYTNSFSANKDHRLLMRQIFLSNEFLRGR